jgi:hypothetical protein
MRTEHWVSACIKDHKGRPIANVANPMFATPSAMTKCCAHPC